MKEYHPAELEEKMTHWAHEHAKLATQWAVMHGEVMSLEDRKKDFLAELTKKADGSSHAEKERNALCSREWKVFREALSEAKKEALEMKIQVDIAVKYWDTARSLLSSKNTERRMA